MKALSAGAFGIKIFGGHFPLAPDAMRTAIRLAYEEHCWIAVHAGSTRTPGNIEGFDELLALAENYPLHVAHINSYCRGSAERTPREDAQHALAALQKAPRCRSESYLANINGTSGRLDAAGIPCSAVTRRSLLTRGYAADRGGMEKAVRDGWARVHGYDPQKQEMVLLEPEAGWHVYCEKNSDVWVSFPVNDQLANILLAAAKDKTGKFIVDALATDGGEIPRNFTLRHGLRLVELDVMSLVELAHKASYAPAQLLGMTDRGYLAAGAAADVIVVNPSTAEVTLAIASGRIILRDGRLCGNIGQILTSSRGLATLRGQTIPCSTTNPSWRN